MPYPEYYKRASPDVLLYNVAGPILHRGWLPEQRAGCLPLISETFLNGVAFMFRSRQEAEERARVGGTAFFVGVPITGSVDAFGAQYYIPYLVSNRHVVFESSACVAAVNRRDGNPPDIWELDQDDWIAHPRGDDVAVTCVGSYLDMSVHKVNHAPIQTLLTEQVMLDMQIGIGDEILMVGRFVNHQGKVSNAPAGRFGNISMMVEEIMPPAFNRKQKPQESFAVEMRSRTGFSGSPVTVYRTLTTTLTVVPPHAQHFDYVLGVNWGNIKDEIDGSDTFLNGVVPAWKILEVFETPKIKKIHAEHEAAARTYFVSAGMTASHPT